MVLSEVCAPSGLVLAHVLTQALGGETQVMIIVPAWDAVVHTQFSYITCQRTHPSLWLHILLTYLWCKWKALAEQHVSETAEFELITQF